MADPPNFKITVDRTGELTAALRRLAGTAVMVGIPSDSEQPHRGTGAGPVGTEKRNNDVIGNATLGYIFENGSPAANIPARPWLAPPIRESQDKWGDYLKQAASHAFAGDIAAMERALHAAGITAVSAVKAHITAGIPPPLAQATIDARRRRASSRKATGAQDVTPLVDTAQFLNAISYVLRKPKG